MEHKAKKEGVCYSKGVATPFIFRKKQEESYIEEKLEMWLDKE